MPISALRPEGWNLERQEILALMEKLRNTGKPLGEYVEGKFYRGILTGLNEAFVIDEETRKQLIADDANSKELIKPWLRGRDIKKWKAEWAGLYVIFTRRGTDIQKYPAVKRHLEKFRKDLEPKKSDKQKQGRKPGSYKWFEIQDNIAYYREFAQPKIVYQVFQVKPCFLLDRAGIFTNNASFIIPNVDEYLLGYLNSPIGWFMIRRFCSPIQNGYQLMAAYFEKSLVFPASATQKPLSLSSSKPFLPIRTALTYRALRPK